MRCKDIAPVTRHNLVLSKFSETMNPDSADVLPVFDIGAVLGKQPKEYSAEDLKLCQDIAECLHQTGCLIVRAIMDMQSC